MKPDQLLQFISKAVDPLRRRVMLMVSRAVIRAVADDAGLQKLAVEVFKNDNLPDMERFQNFGFTGRPLAGADAIIAFLGGNRDNGIILVVDDRRYRLKLEADGESAQYNSEGSYIYCKLGGLTEILASTQVEFMTPLVIADGDLEVMGKGGFNGATPQARITLPANATNDATSYALNNAIKNALIAWGICQ